MSKQTLGQIAARVNPLRAANLQIVNEVRISGTATRDAVRHGRGPYRFSIAVDGGKKRNSDDRYATEFFEVVWWSDRGAQVRKGADLLIAGRLSQSQWEDEFGKHSRVEIVAKEVFGPDITAHEQEVR